MKGGVSLCAAMAINAGDAAPEWLHLLPAGEVQTLDGRGPYRTADVATLMAASLSAGDKLVVDENHSTDLAAPRGLSAPACGWIVELQARVDGIWGRVDWIDQPGTTPIWKKYRGLSPAIMHDKDGAVRAILRVSLTNTPNLVGLKTLHSEGSAIMKPINYRSVLIQILQIGDDADDEEIMDAAVAFKEKAQPIKALNAAVVLSERATSYQAKLAREGLTIDFATAVRHVEAGKRW